MEEMLSSVKEYVIFNINEERTKLFFYCLLASFQNSLKLLVVLCGYCVRFLRPMSFAVSAGYYLMRAQNRKRIYLFSAKRLFLLDTRSILCLDCSVCNWKCVNRFISFFQSQFVCGFDIFKASLRLVFSSC